MPGVTIDLNATRYQGSLQSFRNQLEDATTPELFQIGVLTPAGDRVNLQIRKSNLYVIAFEGADSWYYFDGETGALGKPAGIGSNYNQLGKVGKITYDDLSALGALARFRKGTAIDKRLVAIIIAITSEAARFATVSTYFTGLTNSVGSQYAPWLQGGVDFEYLKSTYFNQWDKPPAEPTAPGSVFTPVARDILVPKR